MDEVHPRASTMDNELSQSYRTIDAAMAWASLNAAIEIREMCIGHQIHEKAIDERRMRLIVRNREKAERSRAMSFYGRELHDEITISTFRNNCN